jgi:hypothetical protein
MRIGLTVSASAVIALGAGCTPSDAESSRNTVSVSENAAKTAGADGSAAYLSAEALEVGCTIAASYAKTQFDEADKPLVLKDATAYTPQLTDEDAATALAYLLGGEKGDPAIRARARAFATLIEKDLFAQCPVIAEIRTKRAFVPAPEQAMPPETPDGLFYTYETLAVSLPLVDLKNGQAFMWTAGSCGPLCGGTGIAMFKRQPDGTWSRSNYAGLTVS